MAIILCFGQVVKMVEEKFVTYLNASKGKTGKAHVWNQVRESESVWPVPDLPLSCQLPNLLICQEKLDIRIFIWNLPVFKYWKQSSIFFQSLGRTIKTTCDLCPAPGQNFFSLLRSMVWHSPRHLSKDYLGGAPSKSHCQGRVLWLVSVKSKPTADVSFLSFLTKKQDHYQTHSPIGHHTLKMKPKGLQLVFISSGNRVDSHQATVLTTSLGN